MNEMFQTEVPKFILYRAYIEGGQLFKFLVYANDETEANRLLDDYLANIQLYSFRVWTIEDSAFNPGGKVVPLMSDDVIEGH